VVVGRIQQVSSLLTSVDLGVDGLSSNVVR
jgi:hypothetical protein